MALQTRRTVPVHRRLWLFHILSSLASNILTLVDVTTSSDKEFHGFTTLTAKLFLRNSVVVVVDIFFCPIRARFQSCEINSGILLDINVHSWHTCCKTPVSMKHLCNDSGAGSVTIVLTVARNRNKASFISRSTFLLQFSSSVGASNNSSVNFHCCLLTLTYSKLL